MKLPGVLCQCLELPVRTEANPVESHQQGQEPGALLYEEKLKDGLKPSSEKAGEMGDGTLDIGVFS